MSNNLKICVYAICKNEEKFVDRWVDSMSEADSIIVVDTGSTDNTISSLKKRGVVVYEKRFTPWRFDEARNYALDKVPIDADVCVSTDLDEVFTKNWRQDIEKVWIKNQTKILKYKYVWNVLDSGEDGLTFYYEKIHARQGFKWIFPVHEILQSDIDLTPYNIAVSHTLTLRHFPDGAKSRHQYLDLLKLSVKENPENDRNTHYLAREFMFNKDYKNAIKYFKRHLKLKSASWKDERSASLRYIGDCYASQNKLSLALKYYKLAVTECCYSREPYLRLAEFYYNTKDYLLSIFTITTMLQIKNRTLNYMSEPKCWNEYPYELLYLSYYNLGYYEKAYENCLVALSYVPNDERIKNNLEFFKSKLINPNVN